MNISLPAKAKRGADLSHRATPWAKDESVPNFHTMIDTNAVLAEDESQPESAKIVRRAQRLVTANPLKAVSVAAAAAFVVARLFK
jgi:ElaB/YqjD/DUF883 family membrane-anchored ribosome-binding protein